MPEKGHVLKIDSTWVADPALGGITITDEPIWASNTGRSSTGKMIGDIVAWKTTIEVSWPPLTFDQAKTIRNALKNAGEFFTLTYYDMDASETVTKTVYCSNIPRTMYSLAQRYRYHQGVKVKFVQQ